MVDMESVLPTPSFNEELITEYGINDDGDDNMDYQEDEPKVETVPKKLNFIELLQHFSTYTGMLLEDLTYLLLLFKENEPVKRASQFMKHINISKVILVNKYRFLTILFCLILGKSCSKLMAVIGQGIMERGNFQ